MTATELTEQLTCEDAGFDQDLFARARAVQEACGKTDVLPRGLIETGNYCSKDCFYCGIRRSRKDLRRYHIPENEVLVAVEEARRRGYPAVAFQSGEIESEANTRYFETLLARCRDLEVTLSLGEQAEDVYRRWRAAGALRYLLRIETSDRALYSRLHPADCSFDRRVGCIRALKRLGFVTGTGVMVGLPGQTAADLARDILFFAEERVDMVGLGPFIPCPGTPLADTMSIPSIADRLRLTLRMIALTRICLRDINIVSATALEALDPTHGRARGLAAGANVIMPTLTPAPYGEAYALYPGKTEARGR